MRVLSECGVWVVTYFIFFAGLNGGVVLFAEDSTSEKASVSIAAAADLAACLDDLDIAFATAQPGISLTRTLGSSGNFRAQIATGAPFEVFLSADISYPQALIDAGLADASSLTTYGIGRIVLWSTTPDVDPKRGFAVLVDPRVRKVAIANPEHAPYGRAAQAALMHEQSWDTVQSKLIYGDNIAQAAHFVQSGNAQVGIVALSLVLAPAARDLGTWWEIPSDWYPELKQAAVLTTRGQANPAARVYLNFLQSPAARTVFVRYGYRLPE